MNRKNVILYILFLALICSGCGRNTAPELVSNEGNGNNTGIEINNTGIEASVNAGNDDTSQANEPIEYEVKYFRYFDLIKSKALFDGNCYQTEINNHIYVFEKNVTEAVREDYIWKLEEALSYLESRNINTSGLSFYVLNECQDYVSEPGVAVLGINNMGSAGQLLVTIQNAMGQFTNYGYLYALSQAVAEELGWSAENTTEYTKQELLALFSGDPQLLNLVYPAFLEDYFFEKVDMCKTFSRRMLADMTDMFAGEEAFIDAVWAYAHENNLTFVQTKTDYAYGGETCPVRMQSKYFDMYRDESFDRAGYPYKDFQYVTRVDGEVQFFADFTYFDRLDRCIDGFVDFFGLDNIDRVRTDLTEEGINYQKANYEAGAFYFTNHIYSRDLDSLLHEFIHHLAYCAGIINEGNNYWNNECLAYYYSIAYKFEGDIEQCVYKEGLLEYIESLIMHPFESMEDYFYVYYYEVYAGEYPAEYYIKSLPLAVAIFAKEFVEVYGEQDYVKCMLTPDYCKELTGMTLDEYVVAWAARMDERKVMAETLEEFCNMR